MRELVGRLNRMYERGNPPSIRRLMWDMIGIGHPFKALGLPIAALISRGPVMLRQAAITVGLIGPDFSIHKDEVSS